MVLVHLTAALQRLRPFKAPMIVVAVSALLALLFTLATMPSAPEPPRAAGEAAMRLVNAEHDLAAASVRTILAAVAAVDEADTRSRAEMRTLAMAEAPRLAVSDIPAAPLANSVRAVQTATAVSKPAPAIEPPLQLLPVVVARQPDRRGPVAERAQALMATVERIPQWLRAGAENIADWAVTAPVKTIARLPERRFL